MVEFPGDWGVLLVVKIRRMEIGRCTFDDLVEVEYEKGDDEDVFDVIPSCEPVPYRRDECDYDCQIKIIPCACVGRG